jgi:hypothetical protein
MRQRRVIGILLLVFTFILLITCQLQLNKSNNALTLRIVVPESASSGAKGATLATNGKSLAGGSNVTVTITQGSTTWASPPPVAINGNSSVDVSVVSPPAGTYQLSANSLRSCSMDLGTQFHKHPQPLRCRYKATLWS